MDTMDPRKPENSEGESSTLSQPAPRISQAASCIGHQLLQVASAWQGSQLFAIILQPDSPLLPLRLRDSADARAAKLLLTSSCRHALCTNTSCSSCVFQALDDPTCSKQWPSVDP